MEKPEEIINNESPQLCASCGGCCCKNYAGFCHPFEFTIDGEVDVFLLADAIFSNYAIDSYEGDIDGKKYYNQIMMVRPRHTNMINLPYDLSWGGTCIFLNDSGCELPFEKRPYQCRAVVPHANSNGEKHCVAPLFSGKYSAAKAWRPYQKELNMVINGERIL